MKIRIKINNDTPEQTNRWSHIQQLTIVSAFVDILLHLIVDVLATNVSGSRQHLGDVILFQAKDFQTSRHRKRLLSAMGTLERQEYHEIRIRELPTDHLEEGFCLAGC